MGGSIFTNTDGVVGKDVGHTAELGEGSNTDGGSEVIDEDSEGGSRGLEDSVVVIPLRMAPMECSRIPKYKFFPA